MATKKPTEQFAKKPPKVNLTVRVDQSLADSLKAKNINISELVRTALETAVNGIAAPGKPRRRAA